MGYYGECKKIIVGCNYHNPKESDYNKFLGINDKVLANLIVITDKEDGSENVIKNYGSMWHSSHYKRLNINSIDDKVLMKVFNCIKKYKPNYFNTNDSFIKSLKALAFDKFSINLFDANDFKATALDEYFGITRWADTFKFEKLLTPHGRYLVDIMITKNVPYMVSSSFSEQVEYDIEFKLQDKSESNIKIIQDYTNKILTYCKYEHKYSIYLHSTKE